MKSNIIFIMPVMRPKSAKLVLQNLVCQSMLIDKIIIVDNSNELNITDKYPFDIELIKIGRNIGVNAVWNLMFNTTDYDYIGLIGDDYTLDNNTIKILKISLDTFKNAAGTTATIFNKRKKPVSDLSKINGKVTSGKGHLGAALFKKCVLDCLPAIPEEFFIFFGDDWLDWWIKKIGYHIYEVSVGIEHRHKTDLKEKLNYPGIIKKERAYWKMWLRGQIEL